MELSSSENVRAFLLAAANSAMSGRPTDALSDSTTASKDFEETKLIRSTSTFLMVIFPPGSATSFLCEFARTFKESCVHRASCSESGRGGLLDPLGHRRRQGENGNESLFRCARIPFCSRPSGFRPSRRLVPRRL